jgi:PAS domain S-box-containing protein
VALLKSLIRVHGISLGFALAVLLLLWRFDAAAGTARNVGDYLPSLLLLLAIGFLAGYLSWQCLGALNMTHRFQHALAALRDAVLVTDDQGRVCFLNGPARALTGWDTDALRQPAEKVLNLLDPDSRQPLEGPLARIRHANNLPLPAGKALLQRRDGTVTAVEHEAEPVPGCGSTPAGVVVIFRDTGERLRLDHEARQREEEARALAACAPVALLHLDRQGRCVWTNPACQALVGFSAEEALGNGWAESLAPQDREVAGEWESAARRGEPYVRDCRFQDEQGRVRWLRLCATPVRSAKGEELGHAGVLEDVTRHKQIEQELAERKQALDALRRGHQEQERLAAARLAAVEKNHGSAQERLAERQRAEEELRRDQTRKQAEWQQAEQKLHQEIAELGKRQEAAREQLARRQQAEEELRRQHAQKQTEWQRSEAQLRKEITELIEMGKLFDAELVERGQREERLWKEQQELRMARERLEEELHGEQELRKRTEADVRTLRASQQRAEDEAARRRKHADKEQALRRVAFLAGASRALGSSLDAAVVRKEIARLPVPLLAEGCLLYQARAGGLPVPVVVAAGDESRTVSEWLAGEDLAGPGSEAVARVIQSGKPLLSADVPESWRHELADTLGRTVRRPLTPASVLCVPLLLDGTAWGAVSFVRGAGAAAYGAEEQALAAEFVRRAAAALAGALHYQEVCRDRDELGRRLQELTERLRREEELRQQTDKTAETNGGEDLWERLASGCRPALARLRDAVRRLPEESLEARQEGDSAAPVTALACETQRLSLLFEKFWAADRLRRGRLRLALRPVELDAVVEQAVAAAHLLLRGRGQHLTVSLPLQPEWLRADGERLAQALAALLEDAAGRTPPGGTVRLTAERCLDRIIIRITAASGERFSGGQAACLSGGDPGQAGSLSYEKNAPGTGIPERDSDEANLGLALVRGLVEMHQGKLSVVGGQQEGSEFVLEFAALAG